MGRSGKNPHNLSCPNFQNHPPQSVSLFSYSYTGQFLIPYYNLMQSILILLSNMKNNTVVPSILQPLKSSTLDQIPFYKILILNSGVESMVNQDFYLFISNATYINQNQSSTYYSLLSRGGKIAPYAPLRSHLTVCQVLLSQPRIT